MRKLLLWTWLGCLFSGIGFLFWHNEWKYTLPTPVPEHYRPVKIGDAVDLGHKIGLPARQRPVFLHFYNPACPCSKFNLPHFQFLARTYAQWIDFGVVVIAKERRYTEAQIQSRLGLQIPVSFDSSLARACGVYSTPQAVLLDAESRLYYRGNYNKSRYCTSKQTNFAQQAIDSLLHFSCNPVFSEAALRSYGCAFPTCVYTTDESAPSRTAP